MGIEYVTKAVSFDNLLVEVTAIRYVCDDCARREAFHDTHKPYNEVAPTPQDRGWHIVSSIDDGTEGARCASCVVAKAKREAPRPLAAG